MVTKVTEFVGRFLDIAYEGEWLDVDPRPDGYGPLNGIRNLIPDEAISPLERRRGQGRAGSDLVGPRGRFKITVEFEREPE